MPSFNVHEAKSNLSQLLAQAERGEDVVISRHGTPVARLVPYGDGQTAQPGVWRSLPGWEHFQYDPAALAPITTDAELAEEGWPV
jgi:prevent-host-death family protein